MAVGQIDFRKIASSFEAGVELGRLRRRQREAEAERQLRLQSLGEYSKRISNGDSIENVVKDALFNPYMTDADRTLYANLLGKIGYSTKKNPDGSFTFITADGQSAFGTPSSKNLEDIRNNQTAFVVPPDKTDTTDAIGPRQAAVRALRKDGSSQTDGSVTRLLGSLVAPLAAGAGHVIPSVDQQRSAKEVNAQQPISTTRPQLLTDVKNGVQVFPLPVETPIQTEPLPQNDSTGSVGKSLNNTFDSFLEIIRGEPDTPAEPPAGFQTSSVPITDVATDFAQSGQTNAVLATLPAAAPAPTSATPLPDVATDFVQTGQRNVALAQPTAQPQTQPVAQLDISNLAPEIGKVFSSVYGKDRGVSSFPVNSQSIIASASNLVGLPLPLALAVGLAETNLDPTVGVNNAGAEGLFQVVPETAGRAIYFYTDAEGNPDFSRAPYTDRGRKPSDQFIKENGLIAYADLPQDVRISPEVNSLAGIAYLKALYDKNNGDIVKTAAEYNGGSRGIRNKSAENIRYRRVVPQLVKLLRQNGIT